MSAILLFDGVCNFCNASVNFVMEHDRDGFFKFASLQSEAGRTLAAEHGISSATVEKKADAMDSLILIEEGHVYTHSTGALRIARRLGAPWSWSYVFIVVPRPIRDFFYRLFAKYRYRLFGRKDECMIPTPEVRARFLTDDKL